MFSRRGFLKSVIAAVGAAAVFDPKSLTWVPDTLGRIAPVEALTLTDARKGLIISDLEEMQAFAMLCARRLASRLVDAQRHAPLIALGSVQYAGDGQAEILRVEGIGRGAFTPAGRTMFSMQAGFLDGRNAATLCDGVSLGGFDANMLVPITAELRPGEPFDPEIIVGVATEPETGVSVRAIRFEHFSRRRLGLEVASGHWQTLAEARAEFYDSRALV